MINHVHLSGPVTVGAQIGPVHSVTVTPRHVPQRPGKGHSEHVLVKFLGDGGCGNLALELTAEDLTKLIRQGTEVLAVLDDPDAAEAVS